MKSRREPARKDDDDQTLRSYSVLQVEIMFYHSARRHLEQAKQGWPTVEKGLERLRKLDEQWERLHADNGVPLSYDRFERTAINTERQFEAVGFAYAPVVEHLATVHLLCANCLEATINVIGKDVLSGPMFDEFDKLSLTGKWLFLPQMKKLKGFDPGTEPFQSFNRLVKFRNMLTHYKPKRERGPVYAVPSVLGTLGLTVKDAEASLTGTRKMIGEIHKQLKRKLDHGWDAANWTYFGVDFKYEKR